MVASSMSNDRYMRYYRAVPLFLISLALSAFSTIATAKLSTDTKKDIMAAADATQSGLYVKQRFLQQLEKPFDPEDSRKALLVIGDSHGQDFFNALLENQVDQRYQIRTRRIPAICGLYLGPENISSLIDKKHQSLCQKMDTLKQALPQIQQADVTILAANWVKWSVERLPVTIRSLNLRAEQKLFVIGRKDFGKVNLRHYLRQDEASLRALRNPVLGAQHEINQIMKERLSSGVFVNIQGFVCQTEKRCPLFTPNTKHPQLITFDGGHLTKAGAKYIGQVLLQRQPLNSIAR